MPKIGDNSKTLDHQKFLIYGDFGAGKTYSIDTFPAPIYVFDFDRGINTLEGIATSDITYDQYWDENPNFPEAYMKFRKKVAELRKNCPYATIVMDSATSLGEKAISNFVRMGTSHQESPKELQDHLQIADKLGLALDEILGIKANIVVFGHPKVVIDETTGALKYLVLQTGTKLPQNVPLYFDEIYRAERRDSPKGESSVYTWQTKADRKWSARSRFNYVDEKGVKKAILEPLEPQDLGAILEKVKEKWGISQG